jgi:hypothetical protein
MSPEARDHSFDELTRGLASGKLSRGKALRLMGAALVGGALASIPGIAEAAPALKSGGRKCRSGLQCETGLCLPSGVCSGFPSGRKASRLCPEGCLSIVLEDGSIGCYSCPSGGCSLATRGSCADCPAGFGCTRYTSELVACYPGCSTTPPG